MAGQSIRHKTHSVTPSAILRRIITSLDAWDQPRPADLDAALSEARHVLGRSIPTLNYGQRAMKLPTLTRQRILEVVSYDPNTGEFTWVENGWRGPHYYRAGSPLITTTANGYLMVMIDGQRVLTHRIAWFLVYDYWPTKIIDHINRDRSDNRIANLRECTQTQNSANNAGWRRRKSPYKGTYLVKGRWIAGIRKDRQLYYLGSFDTAEEAHAAYKAAAITHFGEFARWK